jgi:hypothetical protein
MGANVHRRSTTKIDALPAGSKALDFLIVSYSGDPMVPWRIITLIRERVDKVAGMIRKKLLS